jgi:hypothetical protein
MLIAVGKDIDPQNADALFWATIRKRISSDKKMTTKFNRLSINRFARACRRALS